MWNGAEKMITKSAIKARSNVSAYNKGRAIYDTDRILEFDVGELEDEEGIDYIEALVKGSGRKKYHVTASYNHKLDDIEEIECECPAFYSYSGICKHCVAVLLNYLDYIKEIRAQAKYATKEKEELSLRTTPVIKQFLDEQISKRKMPVVEPDVIGEVRLEPSLVITAGMQPRVNFKIGISQMYVLRDVQTLYSNFKQNSFYSYGKKLGFVHNIEAFREEDRPLVKWLCKWVKNNDMPRYYSNYYMYSSTHKDLNLNIQELEEFIEAMKGRIFEASIRECKDKLWRVVDEKPPRKLKILGEAEGIYIKLDNCSYVVCKTQNIYFNKGKIYSAPIEDSPFINQFKECMSQSSKEWAYIEKQDVPAFWREILPQLESYYRCEKKNFTPEAYGILPVNFEIYLDTPHKDWITCKAEAVYGEKRYNIFDKTQDINFRDQVKEATLEHLIMTYATSYDAKEGMAAIVGEEKMYEVLTEGIDKMSKLGEVFVSDKLKRLSIKSSPKLSLGISVSGEIMELTMISEDLSGEELIDLLSKYKQKRKFYRLKDGSFIKCAGDELETLSEISDSLHFSKEEIKKGKVSVPKYRALYLDAQLKERGSFKTTKNKAFKELIRNMKTVEDNDFEVPQHLDEILREYQKRGFLWLKTLKYNGFGGILADDMGLGKTLQVIAFLLSEHLEAEEGKNLKTLIVCPASLVFNWKAEFEKFAPTCEVKLAVGTTKQRQELLENLKYQDIVVTSYDLLKRDIAFYKAHHFAYEIIDEGQYIKNHNTQAAQAVKEIESDFKAALTGTPIENRLSELWSIFDYLMPGFLYSYTRFKAELEQPIVKEKDEAATLRLQKMIQPFVLRRLKKEVLVDLPDKLEENKYTTLEGEQQKLYDANVKKLKLMLEGQTEETFKRSKIQILSELTRLRQICCDPALVYEDYKGSSAKLEMCLELIQNAISGGHKILLFSQFTTMLDRIKERLEEENISYYLLTGATSKEKRMQMVEAFNQDETSVFCISLKAGGTGLNLTAADIVIHYDPWWNVAVQNQATDRAHRIGQKNVVTVYQLIAKGSIEENIIKIQNLKKELADEVLSGEGINTGNFTKEDLLELLS